MHEFAFDVQKYAESSAIFLNPLTCTGAAFSYLIQLKKNVYENVILNHSAGGFYDEQQCTDLQQKSRTP
jgi:hypothetical protein